MVPVVLKEKSLDRTRCVSFVLVVTANLLHTVVGFALFHTSQSRRTTPNINHSEEVNWWGIGVLLDHEDEANYSFVVAKEFLAE